MVRKWSYISPVSITYSPQSAYMDSLYTFKVFRMTTRFKKFNLGHTVFVRRKYSKRKHRANWVQMSYVTKSWSMFFLKNKQFVRFYQSLGLFNTALLSPTAQFFLNQYMLTPEGRGASILSCSRSIISYFGIDQQVNSYVSPLYNTPATLGHVRSIEDALPITDSNPGLMIYDGLYYPHNEKLPSNVNVTTLYGGYLPLVYDWQVSYLLSYYKVLIHLSLIQLFK
jgi:hypothetical protein